MRHLSIHSKKQAGFSLIELCMVLVIIGLLFMSYIAWSSYQNNLSEATATGNNIAKYIAAVDAKIAIDTVRAGDNFTGINWLLPRHCGGTSDTSYLPCGFSIKTKIMRDDPQVSITDIDFHSRLNATINFGRFTIYKNGVLTPDAGLAATAINAARAYYGSPDNNAFNGVSSYIFDKDHATLEVRVTVQSTQDTWLRVDGNNAMKNNITYHPDTPDNKRQLIDVSEIAMKSRTMSKIISKNAPLSFSAGENAANEFRMENGGKVTISSRNNIGIFADGVLDINNKANSGNINLGKQSGVKGEANVRVNDLIITSKSNTKLTQYLGMVFLESYKINKTSPAIPYNASCTANGGINKIFLIPQIQEVKQFPVRMDVFRDQAPWTTVAFNVPYATSGLRAESHGSEWRIVAHNLTQFEAIAKVYCDYSNK